MTNMTNKVFNRLIYSDDSVADLYDLAKIVSDYDVVVVEGYDMVGKSTLISDLSFMTSILDFNRPGPTVFRPDYENLCYDHVLDRSDRLVIGLSVLDFIRSDKDRRNKLVIFDRGLPSGIVYANLYQDKKLSKDIIRSYEDLYLSMRTCILYVNHKDKSSAQIKYSSSISDNNHNDNYDKFSSFDEYYSSYLQFDKEFIRTIGSIPFGVYKINYSW